MRFLRSMMMLLCAVSFFALPLSAAVGTVPGALSLAGAKPVVHNTQLYLFYLKGSLFNDPTCSVAYTSSFDGVNYGTERLVNLPMCVGATDDFTAASFNGSLYFFFRPANTGDIHYASMDAAGAWTYRGQIQYGSGFDLAVYNNRLYLFWVENGGTWIRNKSMDVNGVWSANTRWSADEATYGVSAAPFGSRLYQVWPGNSGTYRKLWSGYLANGTWGGRQNIDSGDFPLTSQAPDAVEHNGKLYVAYVGSYESRLMYYKALNSS